jgi:hypothetical protein
MTDANVIPFRVMTAADIATHTLNGTLVYVYPNVIPIFMKKGVRGVYLEGPNKGQEFTAKKENPGLMEIICK